MNAPSACAAPLLVLCLSAAGQPVVPGANVTLLTTLPSGYRPYAMDVGISEAGTYAGRWLYISSDNNVETGQLLIRVSLGVNDDGVGSIVGHQHIYSTAVFDPDGLLVDRSGGLTGVPGTVLVASSNPGDNAGRVWKIAASAADAGDEQATVQPYFNPQVAVLDCDSMTTDAQGRLYLNSPPLNQVMRMVGVPENNGATFEAFASLPVRSGTVVYDGLGRIWSSGSDGVLRRIDVENTEGVEEGDALPRTACVEVDLETGLENGLAWSRATPQSGGGAWGGGVLAVRRGAPSSELVRVRAETGTVDVLGTGMGDVFAVKVDDDGVLYAADYSTGEVWRVERTVRLGCGPGDIGGTGGVPVSDGRLSNDDFIVFIDYFFQHDARADRGRTGGVALPDGNWDNNDFVVFIDEFFSGC